MVAATKSTSLRDSLFAPEALTPEAIAQVPLPPSERDFQVFELVAIDGASTRQAAAEFGVSQSRIVQIRRHVAEWMGAEVPPTPRLTPIQRLRVAAEIAERRADHLYSQAMEGWRASQHPQTSICRGSSGNETRTTRERHGDWRYLMAAMRIAERRMHLSGTIRKVIADAREGEALAEPARGVAQAYKAPTSGRGVGQADETGRNDVRGNCTLTNGQGFEGSESEAPAEPQATNPPVRACSHNEADSGNGQSAAAVAVDATDCQDEVCNDIENRRREFLAALRDDAAPVQPPFTDAGGMLLDSSELQSANGCASATALLGEPPVGPRRPLSRKERRARQRILERKLRKAK